MSQTVKLNSTLTFDDSEADLVAMVNSLASRYKLSKFLNQLLRAYYYNPDKFREEMADVGINAEQRKQYLSELQRIQDEHYKEYSAKLNWLAKRVITLEEQLVKLNSLLELHKTLGLPERIQATYCASLVLQSELRKLSNELNVNLKNTDFSELSSRTEELIAYAVEYYDGAMNELKSLISNQASQFTAQPATVAQQPVQAQSARQSLSVQTAIKPTIQQAIQQTQNQQPAQQSAEKAEPDLDAVFDMFGSTFM